MPLRHMPPRVTPPCPARRHNTISHGFPDYLLPRRQVLSLEHDPLSPVEHVSQEDVPTVVEFGQVLLEANWQHGVRLDERPERVGVLELVPEGRLRVLVAATSQQEVDLVWREADRVEDADVRLDL